MGSHGQPDLREQVSGAIERGDFAEAKVLLEQMHGENPRNVDVLNNLAVVHARLGLAKQLQADLLGKGYSINPEHPEVRKNLAEVYFDLASTDLQAGQFEAAISLFEKTLMLFPKHYRAHLEMGRCFYYLGKMEEAIKSFTHAATLEPRLSGAYSGLGVAYMELKLLAEAKGAFQQVLRLEPNSPSAFMHLGLLANMTGLTGVAVNMIRRALELAPESPEAHHNLGTILRDQGEITESYEHYKKCTEYCSQNPDYWSGYLLTLNYLPGFPAETITALHRQSDQIFPTKKWEHPVRDRHPHRKLRVGYLSPDFRIHSVAYFIVGILEAHDSTQFEVTAYSTGIDSDSMTQRISAAVETFVPCHGWSDDRLATRIQEDGIDVLIELSGHTSGHRLAMLRNRVAPVQMTYLGYPNTTGLSAMDWRITDELADPSGCSEMFYTEKMARIEGGFLAYSVNDYMKDLPVGTLPAEKGKQITLGSYNNLAKVNNDVLAAWIRILNRLPHASLIMKARGMRDERVMERLFRIFKRSGIEDSRIVLKGHELLMKDHLACYDEIDLALDTFPYAGTTTTCEALWMGVPVVTLAGDNHAGRVGVSLLNQIGLHECIGKSIDDYIELAVRLASDLPRLATLRRSLRKQMIESPLMDYERMARGIEKTFRQAWIEHCQCIS